MADQYYSNLQVDHDSQYPKYLVPRTHKAEAHLSSAPTYSDKIEAGEQLQLKVGQPHSRKRICGLATKTFYVVVAIIAVIVIAAGVGAGVVGSLAGKSHTATTGVGSTSTSSQSSSAPSKTSLAPAAASTILVSTSTASTISISTSTASTISISTSTVIGPSETLLVDCPSSNNTLYASPSSNELWRKICSRSYLNSNGIEAVVNTPDVTSLNDCIALATAYNVANASNIAEGSSNVCNAVCWRATITGDDFPGYCFGFTTTNSSSNFVTTDDVRCDSAALINQSF